MMVSSIVSRASRGAKNCHSGSALASTGDTGKLYLWKQNLAGQFIEFAETGPE